MLVIDPVPCIDCEACTHECPTQAIYQQDNVPEEWQGYIALNAEMAAVWPGITEKRPPLAGTP
jgi:ferredoxin